MFNYHQQLNFLKSQLNECQIRIEKEELIENKKQIINEYQNQINMTKKLIDNLTHLTKNDDIDFLFFKNIRKRYPPNRTYREFILNPGY